MNSSNFDFSYPPPPIANPPTNEYTEQQQQQQWNWGNQQYLQAHVRPTVPHFYPNQINTHYPPPPLPSVRQHGYHTATPPQRHFSPRTRFNNGTHFLNGPPQTWLRTNYRTRSESEDSTEPKSKITKKRKKPLSQNVPSKKDWNIYDAEKALDVEKQYNKRFKNHSLIIKFPDPELNKEIVSKFHSAIEGVHFQQPSTARFCFVTLKESADADTVISALNKQPFGNGFLIAEHKKDREDDQNIGPGDIDPLTLYVGNLAQEITKEDMVKAFPKCRRIDIGYAKKMKYTRYAFVNFKNVDDSIAAFKQTHSTEMYSKSLIVRFRRLHGTVGMPGESKPQNPPKNKNEDPSTGGDITIDVDEYCAVDTDYSAASNYSSAVETPLKSTADINDKTTSVIKTEPSSDDDDKKPNLKFSYVSPFLPGPVDNKFVRHRPKIKTEIKTEKDIDDLTNKKDTSAFGFHSQENIQSVNTVEIKKEPHVVEEGDFQNVYYDYYDASDSGEELLDRPIDFDQLYQNMANHKSVINSFKEKDSY